MGLNDRKRFGFTPTPIKPASLGGSKALVYPNFIQQQAQSQRATGNVEDIIKQTGTPPGTDLTVGDKPSIQVPLNRKLTADEIKTLSMNEAFDIATSQIENFMNSDPEGFRESYSQATAKLGRGKKTANVYGIPTALTEDSQYLHYLLEDMADRVLRLRSGAQINEDEFGRLRGLLPTYVDILSDEDGSFKSIRRKIFRFRQEFNEARNKILQGTKIEDLGYSVDNDGGIITDFGGQLRPGTQLIYDPELWGDFGPPVPGLNRNRRNL